MKKNFTFMLFCCLLTIPAMSGALTNKCNDVDDIDLNGDIPTKKIQKSLIRPMQVFIVGQSIEVDFNATLEAMSISIYDEMGSAVYQQSIDAYAGQQIFIDIAFFEEGEYTIEFINSQGQYLFEDFIIQ
jgi:hypothetical protein